MIIKKIALTLLLLPFIAQADINSKEQERLKILKELGLPLPGSGIKIIPRSMMDLPEEIIQKGELEERQMQEKGYISDDSTRATELLNFKSHADYQIKQFINNENEQSTHIRTSISKLKLSFVPKKLPKKLITSYIGVVPQGAFHSEGWSGTVQFFESKDIGICAYSQMDVKVSQTAAELAIEGITYLINNKPTIIKIRGSEETGFTYKVKWYDDKNFQELECANMDYSSKLANSVVSLAQIIDGLE